MTITSEILDQHNITPEEYERIKRLMGREPNLTELGIFSVMWSEHCSYKSSKIHLRRLPTEGEFAVRFDVNRHTIRRAIASLESRGLVRVEQGRGIFLQDYAVHYSVGKRARFSETLKQQRLEGSRSIVRSLEIPASAKIAQVAPVLSNPPVYPNYINGGRYSGRGDIVGLGITYQLGSVPKDFAAP